MNLLEALFHRQTYPIIRVRTQAHIEIKQGNHHISFFLLVSGIFSTSFYCCFVNFERLFGFNALFSVTLYQYVSKL